MKKLIGLLALAVNLFSQTPGTITVTTVATGSAGSGVTGITCIISNPMSPAFHIVCSINNVIVLTEDATPSVGAGNGVVGSFVSGTNNITWIVLQPAANTYTWSLAANGVSKNGTF